MINVLALVKFLKMKFDDNSDYEVVKFYAITTFAQQFLVALIMIFLKNWYIRYRRTILALHLGTRSVCSINRSIFFYIQPVQLPDGSLYRLFHQICYLPLFMARVHGGFVLPWDDFHILVSANMIPLTFGTYMICQDEQLIPNQAQKYRTIATLLENLIHRWAPFSLFPGSQGFSDQGICFFVRSVSLWWAGYLIPLALMTSEEVLSRRRFRSRYLRRISMKFPCYSILSLFVRYFALVPLQAIIIFQALALLIGSKWGQRWLAF